MLRLVQSNKNRHKLSPPWEGPYIIAEVLQPGTYKLKTIDDEVFINAWNIEQLCRFTLNLCTLSLISFAINSLIFSDTRPQQL